MEQLVFPITEREAQKTGTTYSSESNRNSMFARRLATLRTEAKMSQQKLADTLEVSKSTISLYEVGDTVPDAKSIVKLSEIFGVSTDYFLCQTDYRSNERERMTVLEAGLTELAAENISKLNIFSDGEQSAEFDLPFAPGAVFNQICEDKRFMKFAKLLADSHQMHIGAERQQDTPQEPCGNLELAGARAMLSLGGETGISMEDASELYLLRACDVLKDIIRSLPTVDSESGEKYHINIRGNIFNPVLGQQSVENP